MSACFSSCPGSSHQLLILAAAAALWLSRDTDSETRGRLAAFFTVLGDILALLALQPELPPGASGGEAEPAAPGDQPRK